MTKPVLLWSAATEDRSAAHHVFIQCDDVGWCRSHNGIVDVDQHDCDFHNDQPGPCDVTPMYITRSTF